MYREGLFKHKIHEHYKHPDSEYGIEPTIRRALQGDNAAILATTSHARSGHPF